MNVEKFISSLEKSEVRDDLNYCDLDKIIKKTLLRKKIREIVELADEELWENAYSKTSDLLMGILHKYVAPKMGNKKEIWFIEIVAYFITNNEKDLAGILKSVNAEFNMVDQPNKNDVIYLLMLVCRTYDMLFERYGELDFEE